MGGRGEWKRKRTNQGGGGQRRRVNRLERGMLINLVGGSGRFYLVERNWSCVFLSFLIQGVVGEISAYGYLIEMAWRKPSSGGYPTGQRDMCLESRRIPDNYY